MEIFAPVAGAMCSAVSDAMTSSLAGWIWVAVKLLWPWQWLIIILLFGSWVVLEVLTRNGKTHYNSENGFSPAFNRVIGAGVYAGLQGLALLFLKVFFGPLVYCSLLPYILHVAIFASTGLLLHVLGFWPYLVNPNRGRFKKRR